jgi:hypothetical protein
MPLREKRGSGRAVKNGVIAGIQRCKRKERGYNFRHGTLSHFSKEPAESSPAKAGGFYLLHGK